MNLEISSKSIYLLPNVVVVRNFPERKNQARRKRMYYCRPLLRIYLAVTNRYHLKFKLDFDTIKNIDLFLKVSVKSR